MSGVLVDTSVWIDHFRNRNETLENLLNGDLALTHPMIIEEIACGTPPAPRTQTLADLGLLATFQHASLHESIAFIERELMYGTGCRLVDINADYAGRKAVDVGQASRQTGRAVWCGAPRSGALKNRRCWLTSGSSSSWSG